MEGENKNYNNNYRYNKNYNNNKKRYNTNKDNQNKPKLYQKSFLDPKFKLEESYFNKPLSEDEWEELSVWILKFLNKDNKNHNFKLLFEKYPNLYRGEENKNKLRALINETYKTYIRECDPEHYMIAINTLIDQLYSPKPFLVETLFFPSETNEDDVVVNVIRTAKKTLEICIFTLTNDKLFQAVEECWKRGVEVRIITDDECAKQKGSDIYKLASIGVPIKTDSSSQYHMHHKFVVIDEEVIVTGSFNWTIQAVQNNNENILILQNKYLAQQYTDEFDKLWEKFTEEITQEEGIKLMAEADNKK